MGGSETDASQGNGLYPTEAQCEAVLSEAEANRLRFSVLRFLYLHAGVSAVVIIYQKDVTVADQQQGLGWLQTEQRGSTDPCPPTIESTM